MGQIPADSAGIDAAAVQFLQRHGGIGVISHLCNQTGRPPQLCYAHSLVCALSAQIDRHIMTDYAAADLRQAGNVERNIRIDVAQHNDMLLAGMESPVQGHGAVQAQGRTLRLGNRLLILTLGNQILHQRASIRLEGDRLLGDPLGGGGYVICKGNDGYIIGHRIAHRAQHIDDMLGRLGSHTGKGTHTGGHQFRKGAVRREDQVGIVRDPVLIQTLLIAHTQRRGKSAAGLSHKGNGPVG